MTPDDELEHIVFRLASHEWPCAAISLILGISQHRVLELMPPRQPTPYPQLPDSLKAQILAHQSRLVPPPTPK